MEKVSLWVVIVRFVELSFEEGDGVRGGQVPSGGDLGRQSVMEQLL